MRNSFSRLGLGILFFCILACKKNKETPQTSSEIIVPPPRTIPVKLSNVDTTGCKQSLFAPCIISCNTKDSIYSKDGILNMYIQNKSNQLFNTASISTYNQPIKGDFELDITVMNYDFSFSNNPKSSYFLLNLGNVSKTIKTRYSYEEGNMLIYGIDTLRHEYVSQQLPKHPEPCPNEINFQISRQHNMLIAKQYFCFDSLVKRISDFGNQDLDLSFILSSDTSSADYSKMKITKLELKMGNGIGQYESFCENKNFIQK